MMMMMIFVPHQRLALCGGCDSVLATTRLPVARLSTSHTLRFSIDTAQTDDVAQRKRERSDLILDSNIRPLSFIRDIVEP